MATLLFTTSYASYPVVAPSQAKFNLPHFHFHPHASPQRRRVAVFATSAEPGKPDSTQIGKSESVPPKKPVYSLKKKQIVRVNKEKYLNSVNYLSVGHPPYYKGLDYIYEDRGEVLDVRIFETGEYALIAWVGIPTPPAWLPTYMLIKADKLSYERM